MTAYSSAEGFTIRELKETLEESDGSVYIVDGNQHISELCMIVDDESSDITLCSAFQRDVMENLGTFDEFIELLNSEPTDDELMEIEALMKDDEEEVE